MTVHYRLRAESAGRHRVDVTLELRDLAAASVDLLLPSWVPGSYVILDYAKNLDGMTARRPDTGEPKPVLRVDKARWRVDTGGATAIDVDYSVYAHGLVTEGFDLTAEHLFVNAALGLPAVVGRTDEPYELTLHVPSDWRVYSELPAVGHGPTRLRAATYDELVDSPIDCGTPVELGFHAAGVPHRILLCGQGGNYEAHRLETDLAQMASAAIALVGECPVAHYTFFYHLTDVRDGGLEHATSNSCVIPRRVFRPASSYAKFLDLSSHEYFHLYNVKRIRPKAFDRFDYSREMYTTLLWAMEGMTDYYGQVVLRRAGLASPRRFLEHQAEEIGKYLATPGRRVRSLAEASYLAWIDLYKPMEETPNRSVSYYRKGSLVSLCLDLEIRDRTENRASLDTVLRLLWNEYGRVGRGIDETEFAPIASRATGLDLDAFFAKYVAGTDEIDFAQFARRAGLAFGPKPKPADDEEDAEPGWLGIEYEKRHGLVRLTHVLEGGPGRRGGLSPGDELVAIDRVKVDHDGFVPALARLAPGATVEFTVFRRGYLTTVPVTLGAPPPAKYQFTPRADATALQRSIYEGWIAAPWEPPKDEGRSSAVPPGAGDGRITGTAFRP